MRLVDRVACAVLGRAPGRPTADAGFSLVLVLLVIGALAAAAVMFVQGVRALARQAASQVTSVRLELDADAGVQMAVLDIVGAARDRQWSRRFPPDAKLVRCGMTEGVVLSVRVQDEAGKVDLNVASEKLLLALVKGLGLPRAEALTDSLLDYRDSDRMRRPSGAEEAEYLAAGRKLGPRNGPFQALDELGQVLGMTEEALGRLRPHVTLHSGQEGLDPLSADPALVAVLARGASGLDVSATTGDLREAPLPREMRGTSMRRSFTIQAQARASDGATFVREAVIELTAPRGRPYILRSWSRPGGHIDGHSVADALPPC